MNAKAEQALQKGKEIALRIWEIAKPLCIKGKALALQGYDFAVALCADVYVVPNSEKDLLALLNEPSKFVSEFKKRYGSN